MKKILLDFLFGLLIFIVVYFFEFLVTLPLGISEPPADKEAWRNLIGLELLLTAVPAAFTTFGFTWLLKTKTKEDAWRRAIIWAVVIGLIYAVIGILNGNADLVYGNIGIYALLLCALGGPVIYAKLRHLT